MNWRGRPLTSHEVVVNTIASTTTRAGLRVHAELDPGAYPLGVAISKARMQALPIEPHPVRGTWNYTLRPAPTDQTAAPAPSAAAERATMLEMLGDPRLTGMTSGDLDALAKKLATAQRAQWEQQRYEARGGPRRQRPGTHGKKPLLNGRDRILVTLLYLRRVCSQRVLREMLEINDRTMSQVVTDTRLLLREHKVSIEPTTLLFSTPDELRAFLRTGQLASRSREPLPEILSDPALTGMSRTDLAALVDRLALRQAARVERRRHQQRGGPRQPGTRGGVFPQKIGDPERVLAAVLFHRRVCTGEVLAELFQVSRRTIGNAFLDVRPLLEEDGFHLKPAPRKYRTVGALLASVPQQGGPPS